jgi:hypothetical protein
VLQRRKAIANALDLLSIQSPSGNQHPTVARRESCLDRFRSEGGKQRAEHSTALEGPEGSDVQLRDAASERENPVAPTASSAMLSPPAGKPESSVWRA